jgi:hypothetical protein
MLCVADVSKECFKIRILDHEKMNGVSGVAYYRLEFDSVSYFSILKAGGCLVQIIKDHFYQEADFAPGLTKWRRVLGDPIKVNK